MPPPSGLVALRSEEVLELMAAEYAGKYGEYQVVLQEREFQATLRRKMMESKRVAFLVREGGMREGGREGRREGGRRELHTHQL